MFPYKFKVNFAVPVQAVSINYDLLRYVFLAESQFCEVLFSLYSFFILTHIFTSREKHRCIWSFRVTSIFLIAPF